MFQNKILSDEINGTKFEPLLKYFDWGHIPAKTAKNKLHIKIEHEVSAEDREQNDKEELIDNIFKLDKKALTVSDAPQRYRADAAKLSQKHKFLTFYDTAENIKYNIANFVDKELAESLFIKLEKLCWSKTDDFAKDGKTVSGHILTFHPLRRPNLVFSGD